MEPWYKLVTPRKEVREGRSFNPDEFAIALDQVVAGSAPDDYKKPEQFVADLLRALRDKGTQGKRGITDKGKDRHGVFGTPLGLLAFGTPPVPRADRAEVGRPRR